jgi:ketosteroid isomerase-like protein
MRLARGIALLGVAYALAGCGTSQGDEVQAKLQQFAHAVAQRDSGALCDDVLAPALIRHLTAIGLTCDQAMKTFVSGVQNPKLSVSAVAVHGRSATAIVRSGARGQPTSRETVGLTRTAHGWRLTSLASPR